MVNITTRIWIWCKNGMIYYQKKKVQVTIHFEEVYFFFSEPQGSLYKLPLNVNLEGLISYSKQLIHTCHRKNMLIMFKYQKDYQKSRMRLNTSFCMCLTTMVVSVVCCLKF